MRSIRTIPPLLVLALLGACAAVRDYEVRVIDAESREPVAGVRVRAIALNSGMVPLPLNAETIDEALSLNVVEESSTTDREGVASLRLRRKAPYLLELSPPPTLALEDPTPDRAAPPMRFHFNARTREIAPHPRTARTEWWPYTLERTR